VRRFGLALMLVATPASALEVLHQSVDHFNGQYVVRLELLVDVPFDYVEAALLDFEHLAELNPGIGQVVTSPVNQGEQRWRVESHIHSCFWFRCIDLDRVEEVSRIRPGLIQSVTLPDQSDFSTGFSQWTLQSWGEQTHVDFHSGFHPDKGEVPVIGPMVARYVIRREALQTYRAIEERFAQRYAKD
jgi:hypothetical protein